MIDFKRSLLLGHRGARGEVLENTLVGFEHAQNLQESGLAGVEFDVQLSGDGHLVIFHDDNLERMCGQQSYIEQLSMAEIQRYLQFGHKIITLQSMTPALKNYRYIELEVKTHNRTDYDKLVKALHESWSIAQLPTCLLY